MVYVDIPAQQLQRDSLAAALRGSSEAVTSGEALGILANASVDLPGREDLLVETVVADDVADPVRGAALRALAGTSPDRALAVAREVREPGERLALAALGALGGLGGPDDVAVTAPFADAPGLSPVVAARAGFARTLLMHRFGLEDRTEPPELDLVPEPGTRASAFVSSPTAVVRAAAVLGAVQYVLPEVSAETHLVLDVACRDVVVHLVLRRDLQEPGGRAAVLAAPAVLGVVASVLPEHDTISTDLFVLSRPSADGLALTVTRTTGEPIYAGTAESTPDTLAADLRAVHRPGAVACRIRALASDADVEVFGRSGTSAAVAPRVPERRPEGDPSATPPT
jgi:hypothetical protein